MYKGPVAGRCVGQGRLCGQKVGRQCGKREDGGRGQSWSILWSVLRKVKGNHGRLYASEGEGVLNSGLPSNIPVAHCPDSTYTCFLRPPGLLSDSISLSLLAL